MTQAITPTPINSATTLSKEGSVKTSALPHEEKGPMGDTCRAIDLLSLAVKHHTPLAPRG